MVAVEDLAHRRDRTKSRNLSWIIAPWMRSMLREGLGFRSQAGTGCSRLETVHFAYTSQSSPVWTCGYAHQTNRPGERFHGLSCRRDGDADVVAAMHRLTRVHDPKSIRCAPVDASKRILAGRFQRRKETRNHALVRETARHSRLDSSTRVGLVDGRIADRVGPPAESEQYEKAVKWIVVDAFRIGAILDRKVRVGGLGEPVAGGLGASSSNQEPAGQAHPTEPAPIRAAADGHDLSASR